MEPLALSKAPSICCKSMLAKPCRVLFSTCWTAAENMKMQRSAAQPWPPWQMGLSLPVGQKQAPKAAEVHPWYPLVIKHGNGKSPMNVGFKTFILKSPINAPFSIAMFDYERVNNRFSATQYTSYQRSARKVTGLWVRQHLLDSSRYEYANKSNMSIHKSFIHILNKTN